MSSSFFQKSLISFIKSEAMKEKEPLEKIILRAGYKYVKEKLNSPNKGLVNKKDLEKLNLLRGRGVERRRWKNGKL